MLKNLINYEKENRSSSEAGRDTIRVGEFNFQLIPQ